MKLLVVAAIMLVAPEAPVRFESEGVRIGGVLVQGTVVGLQSSGPAALLASASSVESLSPLLEVQLAPDRLVRLEPGVRVTRADGGYRFSTYENRKIRFAGADGGTLLIESPAFVSSTEAGWEVGGRAVAGGELRAGLQNQDDTDSNLDRMKASAERMKQGTIPKLSGRSFRRWRGSPVTAAEAADSVGVRQITQVSPTGSP